MVLKRSYFSTMQAMAFPNRGMMGYTAYILLGQYTFLRYFPTTLTHISKRTRPEDADDMDDVVWAHIEDNIQHTKADVLEIFDW